MIKPIEKTVAVVQSVDVVKASLFDAKCRVEVIQNDLDPKCPEYVLFGRIANALGSIQSDLSKFQKSAKETYSRGI